MNDGLLSFFELSFGSRVIMSAWIYDAMRVTFKPAYKKYYRHARPPWPPPKMMRAHHLSWELSHFNTTLPPLPPTETQEKPRRIAEWTRNNVVVIFFFSSFSFSSLHPLLTNHITDGEVFPFVATQDGKRKTIWVNEKQLSHVDIIIHTYHIIRLSYRFHGDKRTYTSNSKESEASRFHSRPIRRDWEWCNNTNIHFPRLLLLRCHVCLVSFWGPGNWTLYAHSVSLTLPFIDRSDWTWGGTHRVRAHKMSLKWRKKKNPSEVTVVEAAIILRVGVTNQPIPHYLVVVAINDCTIYRPALLGQRKTERKNQKRRSCVKLGGNWARLLFEKEMIRTSHVL